MAYVGVTNTSVPLLSQAAASWIYATTQSLKLAGWVTVAWGGGATTGGVQTYNVNATNATDTVLVSAATWNSTGAWKVLRDPSGTSGRQLFFGMGTLNSNAVAVKYSKATGFGGNTGSQTATVWATTGASGDGQVLWATSAATDNGTTGSGFALALTGSATVGYVQAVASNTAENGVYAVYSWTYQATTGVPAAFFCLEAVAAGSYNAADQDPCYQVCTAAPNTLIRTNNAIAVGYWNKYGLSGAAYLKNANISGTSSATTVMWPNTVGLNPYGGDVGFFPSIVGVVGQFPKGYSTGLVTGGTVQNACDTFNLSTVNPKVCVYYEATASFYVPWVQGVVPLV